MLEAVAQRYQAMQKESIPKQLQLYEARLINCDRNLNEAESKTLQIVEAIKKPLS